MRAIGFIKGNVGNIFMGKGKHQMRDMVDFNALIRYRKRKRVSEKQTRRANKWVGVYRIQVIFPYFLRDSLTNFEPK